jgi:hypothetical protein
MCNGHERKDVQEDRAKKVAMFQTLKERMPLWERLEGGEYKCLDEYEI